MTFKSSCSSRHKIERINCRYIQEMMPPFQYGLFSIWLFRQVAHFFTLENILILDEPDSGVDKCGYTRPSNQWAEYSCTVNSPAYICENNREYLLLRNTLGICIK